MKTVASDFDNTLYVKDEEELKNNIEKVRKFIEEGNNFIIITGRSYTNIKKEIDKHNIPYTYLVCQDGANIFNSKNECMKSNLLDKDKASKISSYLAANNLEHYFESAFNDQDTIENATKITVCVNNIEEARAYNSEIKSLADVYSYVSSKHINVIDDYVNKCEALDYLINNDFIDENLTVIGDDINDFEMLSKYDGVIMEKHSEVLDCLHKKKVESVASLLNNYINN